MAEKQFGGWYDNPATGTNMRWWGDKGWTTGSDPTQGGGTSSPASTSSAPSSNSGDINLNVPSIAEYTDKAYAPADEALKAYVLALRSQRQPLDVYSELETAAGLPGMKKVAGTLREQIGSLEDTLKRVEPNVAATTRESLVTQGQRAGMIEARRQPLIEDLGTLTTGLGRISESITAAGADLGTRIGLYLQGQEQALKPYEVQLSAMNDRAARLVTGFTADVQNGLTTLLAKWNRQNELDDKEVDQAFELLKIEKNYSNELAKMVEQSKIDISEYRTKKGIDDDGGTGTGSSNKYYGTGGTYYNSNTTPSISNLWG
jgi:hypothetical protein